MSKAKQLIEKFMAYDHSALLQVARTVRGTYYRNARDSSYFSFNSESDARTFKRQVSILLGITAKDSPPEDKHAWPNLGKFNVIVPIP